MTFFRISVIIDREVAGSNGIAKKKQKLEESESDDSVEDEGEQVNTRFQKH